MAPDDTTVGRTPSKEAQTVKPRDWGWNDIQSESHGASDSGREFRSVDQVRAMGYRTAGPQSGGDESSLR